MAKARTPGALLREQSSQSANSNSSSSNAIIPQNEEEQGLLTFSGDEDDDLVVQHANAPHSALAKSNGNGTPRTPNRVRFDLTPTSIPPPANGHGGGVRRSEDGSGDDIELGEHDPLYNDDDDDDSGAGHQYYNGHNTSRLPLLTDIEAPSVTVANSWRTDEDVHSWHEAEQSRPKSGMRSAFMNMANSIIGAGIIGQPYAFKNAGLLAGVVLLVGLTIIVDWTIRLIVVNSKLSGANSFQGTVEHCFGRTGLIAISVAQWAFAFGGMVAFGVVVGDSIPHVLEAVFPGLRSWPVLGLLADRRVVIAVFIMGVSYPLTLYRDIAKVGNRRWSGQESQWYKELTYSYSWQKQAHLL